MPRNMFISGTRAPQQPWCGPTYYDMPYDEFVKNLKELGGVPDDVLKNREMMEIMVPILRKDFQMYETYKYKNEVPLDCPITIFGGIHDRSIAAEDVEGWSEQTTLLFSKHMLDGGHLFILSHLKDIIDIIIKTLALNRPF